MPNLWHKYRGALTQNYCSSRSSIILGVAFNARCLLWSIFTTPAILPLNQRNTPNQKLSDARHLASPSARHLLVICLWSTARHSNCQSVHLCRLLPQRPQRLQLMFLSQARCASEPMLRRKHISHFPSFFNETPLWSGSTSSLGQSASRVSVIWHQCSLLPSCYVDSMTSRPSL